MKYLVKVKGQVSVQVSLVISNIIVFKLATDILFNYRIFEQWMVLLIRLAV